MRALCAYGLLSILILFSSASADVLVSLPDTSACRDSVLCVPITVGDVTGQNVVAFACSVNFDQAIVNAVPPFFDASAGLASGWTILDTVNNTAGWLKIGGFGTSPLAGSGQLLCLNFSVLPGASGGSASPLNFASFEFNEGIPAANTTDGSITVLYPIPGQVTGVTASNDLCDGVHITWTPITHVSGYQIFRNDTLVTGADSNAVGQTDWTASVGTHQYKVRAFSACGNGPFSTPVSGTRLGIPGAPSPVVASDTSCLAVWVTWPDVTGETSYQVNRDGVPIGLSLPANTTSYQDITASPGVTYEYVVLAINVCGNIAASDSGRRLAPPDAPGSVDATDYLCPGVLVTWQDVANETTYVILRDGSDISGPLPINSTSYMDNTCTPGVQYEFHVVAVNRCGETAVSTMGMRRDVPAQVTGVTASDTSCNGVYLWWTPMGNISGYQIFRNDTLVTGADSNATGQTDWTAPVGTHQYKVRGINACGNGPMSDPISGTRLGPPAQVTGVTATTDRCDSVVVNWNEAAGASEYFIFRAGVQVGIVPAGMTRFADAPAVGTYQYRVRAWNNCDWGEHSDFVEGTRLGPPAQVAGVAATDNLCNGVQVSWNAVASVDSFQIRREGSRIGFASSAQSNYLDTTAVPWTVYEYTVVAYNLCGASPVSLPDNGMRMSAPAQVIGVTATTDRCDSIIVTWTDIEYEEAYAIFRNETWLSTLPPNTVRFGDEPLPGEYNYTVQAANSCGPGVMSAPALGQLLAVPAQVTGVSASDNACNGVIVTWNNVADEDSFQIRRDGTRIAAVLIDVLTYTDTTAVAGTVYSYSVVAYNSCGAGPESAPDNGVRRGVPSTVTDLTASDIYCDSVVVTWTDVSDEDLYRVWRDGTDIGTTPTNVLVFVDEPPEGVHAYAVRAENACGNGALSLPDSGSVVPPPGVPTNVSASDDQCGQIIVTWQAASGDVDGYVIYRDGTGIDSISMTTFTDDVTGTFVYTVRAFSNECGGGTLSDPDSGTGHAGANVPTGLTFVTPATCDSIRFTWDAAGGEVEQYYVYRDQTRMDSTTDIHYTDLTVEDAALHGYQVAAMNSYCGESARTESVNGYQLPLVDLIEAIPDSLPCSTFVSLRLSHCGGVEQDSFYLSLSGGPFVAVGGASPPVDSIDVPVVNPGGPQPNSRLMIVSQRGARADTILSDPFYVDSCVTSAGELSESGIPKEFYLDQNFPNPFNPLTTIRFGVPHASRIILEVYDVLGRRAATLARGTWLPGVHEVAWNCATCASGMYIVRLRADNIIVMRKMLLMK